MLDSLDNRYASALFMIAKDDNKINEYQKEIKEIKTLFLRNEKFLELLKSEFIDINKRYETVDKVLNNYSLPIRNFIKVIIQNHRLNAYLNIFMAFNSLCNEHNGVVEGIIYSVDKLDEKKIKEIEDALTKKNHAKVELINKIDSSLIGGIKVVINNHIYDYSIINELNQMRAKLSK